MPHGSKLLFKRVSSILCNNSSLLCYQSDTSVLELYDKVTPLTPLKAKPALSNEDIMRYSRQLLLPDLGVKGTDATDSVILIYSAVSILSREIYGMTEHNGGNVVCPQVS